MIRESSNGSILPSSTSFSLDKVGKISNAALTGNTSWTVSGISASLGTASVYLMTFLFQKVNGILTITATNSDGSVYSREIRLSNFSLASGNVRVNEVALYDSFTLKYYMWDAPVEYVPNISNYNTITFGVATNSCSKCPTYDQIQMYLGAGVYYDNMRKWKDASTRTFIRAGFG